MDSSRSKHLLGCLAAGFLLALACLETSGSPATAALATCGTEGNFFAGTQKATYETSVFGVRARIEYRDPQLCNAGASPSASAAWAMLIPATPATQYAQVGYAKIGATNPYYPSQRGHTFVFAQNTYSCAPNCAGSNVATTWAGAPLAYDTYSVFLKASDDRIHMTAGTQNIATFVRDVSGEWSNAWSGQFAAETFHTASDVPGTSANPTHFNYIQKYNSAGGLDFINSLINVTDPGTRYHMTNNAAAVGGRMLDVWTDPL